MKLDRLCRLVRHALFGLSFCKLNKVVNRITDNLPDIGSIYLCLFLCLFKGPSAYGINETSEFWSIGEVSTNQSCLTLKFGSKLDVLIPNGEIIPVVNTLHLPAKVVEESQEVPASDIGLLRENGLVCNGVPVPGEIVTCKDPNKTGSNSNQEFRDSWVQCTCDDGLWIQIIGGLIGIGLGCILISLPNAKKQTPT